MHTHSPNVTSSKVDRLKSCAFVSVGALALRHYLHIAARCQALVAVRDAVRPAHSFQRLILTVLALVSAHLRKEHNGMKGYYAVILATCEVEK